MYSFSRCSVELRDTNTDCVIGSLAICYGIRLWLVWAVVYVVTFAQALLSTREGSPSKGGCLTPPAPGSAIGVVDNLAQKVDECPLNRGR